METFTMSRKELPRPGLMQAALAGQITNREGAGALQLSVRQFQRLKARVRLGGPLALRHRTRGRPSSRRLPAAVCARVQALLQDRYAGFNDTHLTEKLREVHGLPISRESVRRLRRALGWPAVHRRRPPQHRARRPREAAAGQLLQLDGSPFRWLEDRGPTLTLLGAIDDATSLVLALHFRPTEDLHGYVTLLHHVFRTYGLPVALYGDGVNILVRTDRHWSVPEQLAGRRAPTHLGRVLHELGIGYVQAHSPQAKGRIERLWATLQDRLVSELRLRGVATPEAANAFVPEFLADFNRRFARPPAVARPVWRPAPRDLALVLSCRYQRVVARDNTVALGWRRLAIPRGPRGRSYAGCRVEVRELLDGRVVILHAGTSIACLPAPAESFTLAPRSHPAADRRPHRRARVPAAAPLHRAVAALAAALPRSARRHPWRAVPFSPVERRRQARRNQP
jgi:transposase